MKCSVVKKKNYMQAAIIISYADDTRSRNRRQKLAPETGVGFWRQFFTPVAKFLAPETNTDE